MKFFTGPQKLYKAFKFLICVSVFISVSGCAIMMQSATSDMMSHLSDAILNNNDLKTVEQGAPSYLLMVDSLIAKDPKNVKILYSAANLYCSYSGLFVNDPERSKKMADKALKYARQAVCLNNPKVCNLTSLKFEEFERTIASMGRSNIAPLYSLGNAWARWIIANSDNFDAVADIASIEVIMKRVTEIEPAYQDGGAWVYLGTLSCLLPPALGGTPEIGKAHYEKALMVSHEKNLAIKVMYAKYYAKITYNRELHDKLLKDVLSANAEITGYTLINTWAKTEAEKLLLEAEDYF